MKRIATLTLSVLALSMFACTPVDVPEAQSANVPTTTATSTSTAVAKTDSGIVASTGGSTTTVVSTGGLTGSGGATTVTSSLGTGGSASTGGSTGSGGSSGTGGSTVVNTSVVKYDAGVADAPQPSCGTFEICSNGLDDNCNGMVDEGCDVPAKADASVRNDASAPSPDTAPLCQENQIWVDSNGKPGTCSVPSVIDGIIKCVNGTWACVAKTKPDASPTPDMTPLPPDTAPVILQDAGAPDTRRDTVPPSPDAVPDMVALDATKLDVQPYDCIYNGTVVGNTHFVTCTTSEGKAGTTRCNGGTMSQCAAPPEKVTVFCSFAEDRGTVTLTGDIVGNMLPQGSADMAKVFWVALVGDNIGDMAGTNAQHVKRYDPDPNFVYVWSKMAFPAATTSRITFTVLDEAYQLLGWSDNGPEGAEAYRHVGLVSSTQEGNVCSFVNQVTKLAFVAP